MSLPFHKNLLLATSVLLLVGCSHKSDPAVTAQARPQITRPVGVLRVCSDPNNLPFSNNRGEGFENKLAEMIAADLGVRLDYTWWAQRRGFFRNTLKAGTCDVVMGVPSGFEMAATTIPYYRSSYVFVSRRRDHLQIQSFDDPRLRQLRLGVQMIGDDFANTPAAHALTHRNIVQNVRGYTLYGDYSKPNPPARILDAVAHNDIDVAIVWGPLAGYFAKQQQVGMDVVPVSPQIDQPFLPLVFDISMGVRRDDQELKEQLERVITARRTDIDKLLNDYGVPRLDKEEVKHGS